MIREKHSHIDADEEQKRLLDLQRQNKDKNRALNIALTAAFFAFIYVFAILFWVLPDRDVSYEENRGLASAPEFSMDSLASGKYTADFAVYMADQFPARDFFVGLKASCERLLLKGENNGVIFADGGYLVKRFDAVDGETLKRNVGSISSFAKAAEDANVDVTVAVAGRTADVARSVLPSVYSGATDGFWEATGEYFAECGAEWVDLMTPLRELFDEGEPVYYKTDHHWTTYGAFRAYGILADEMGIEPRGEGFFTKEVASDEFFGTTWSSAGAKWIDPDTIEFYRFDGDEDLVTDRGDEQFDGLYKLSFLNEKDKYSAFLGGNAARIDVTSKDGEREKILVIKDSFFHSAAPFFAADCDLIILDMRYTTESAAEICVKEGIDKVLILLNAETLGEESGLGRLGMGLGLFSGNQ